MLGCRQACIGSVVTHTHRVDMNNTVRIHVGCREVCTGSVVTHTGLI